MIYDPLSVFSVSSVVVYSSRSFNLKPDFSVFNHTLSRGTNTLVKFFHTVVVEIIS